MKITFPQVQTFINSYEEIKDNKMPLPLAFALSRIAKQSGDCLNFYQEQYNIYLEQYAEKNEEGYKLTENKKGIVLKKETINEAREKFKELDNWEFDIDIKKIPLSFFEKLELSPTDLMGFLPFIDEEN